MKHFLTLQNAAIIEICISINDYLLRLGNTSMHCKTLITGEWTMFREPIKLAAMFKNGGLIGFLISNTEFVFI